jgi:hypothetical protein
MSELYSLDNTDQNVVLAAELLLRKLAASRTIRPAQLVTVAKLQHVLSVLPQVTNGVIASVSIANQMQFNTLSTTFIWQLSVEEDRISVSCGYNEYDPAIGGDYCETMRWSARQGKRTEYNDLWDERWMVPDLGYYPDNDIDIDFASGEYSVTVEDDDNPRLEPDEGTILESGSTLT